MTDDLYSGWGGPWTADGRNVYDNPEKCGLDNPEKCGLEIVETTEADLSYEFDMVVLWRKPDDGEQYWAADAGCSCPIPFEDIHALGDLTPLRGSEERYADEVRRVKAIR